MDNNRIHTLPEYPYLTELMTDEEIDYFNKANFEHVVQNYASADYWTAQINQDLWKRIWKYREELDAFYEDRRRLDA